MTKGYEQRKKANQKYIAKLDNFSLRMPGGHKDTIKAAADAAGMSLNAYILQAVDMRMQREAEDQKA